MRSDIFAPALRYTPTLNAPALTVPSPLIPDHAVPSPSAATGAAQSAGAELRARVAARASAEGRTDSPYPGLRYYRFSTPTAYRKTQLLVPGVVVVLQGRKTIELAGRALTYAAMQCLVLGGAAICHGTVVQASPELPYLALHLDLPPEMLVKTLIALERQAAGAPRPLREHYVAPLEADLLDALARLLPATDAALDRAMLAPLVVEEIVVRLLRGGAAAAIRDAAAVTRSAIRIQQSMQFIQAHVARPLSVAQLAGQAAMSPSHYAHSFRAVAGVSPMRYVRDARLDLARTLLLGAGARPSEAAARAGFDSSAHFTREFRRRFELSPGEYQRRMAAADPQW
ncbi:MULTISPECIES: AraC family transcriptional regulator N-terminal domain-containing protein [unclassified Janthinobacterium]|uniref:AraC family transcriptional regulator N-terminal domain-containing protein n=1 Tax=unclassified Janthinobacterium TaxID=2610881 RepID=UPI00034D635C|nr:MULTISPECIES: AraC family transcriptional regulator N-terminal domain-containing protein [unclassified Janthinobacterium]MEC5159185.1 AraC-like DNA-binding protein [Janthinobacterium sp. CG_S6]